MLKGKYLKRYSISTQLELTVSSVLIFEGVALNLLSTKNSLECANKPVFDMFKNQHNSIEDFTSLI